MTLKADWINGDTYDAAAANAVATQVNTNTSDIAGKQDHDTDLDAWAGKTAPTGAVVGTTDSQALTNKDMSGTNTWPTFNQNTTGSAASLTTSRTFRTNLASTSTASFDGTANVTPGVTGTLAVGNGGTGATTLAGAAIVVGSSNGTPAGKTCWTGTAAQYAAIGSKDSSTIYFVT